MTSPRTKPEDLRPFETRRLLKLLVLPLGLIFGSILYALSEGLPINSTSPVYVYNDIFTTGAMLFVTTVSFYTGKTRARTEARAEAEK